MFSQPSIKRVNMTQPYMPIQQIQSNIPMYNLSNQMDYSNSYQNMNMSDNVSYYSSASTATNLTNNLKKKNFMDEFNTTLSNCISSLLPKIAEECADLVFSKISFELDKQSKEIDELKTQLTQFESIIRDKLNLRIFNVDSTPYKNLRQFNGELSEINSIISDQSNLLKEFKANGNKPDDHNYQTVFDCFNKKISLLKGEINEERKMAEKFNSGIRDRYVDLLGVKNLIDNKISCMIGDLKFKSTVDNTSLENIDDIHSIENETKLGELVNIVDVLHEKMNVNKGSRKEFSNLEIHNNERNKQNYEMNLKNNILNTPNVIIGNQKQMIGKDNYNQVGYNFSSSTNSSVISHNGNMDSRASIKAKNSTNAKKPIKRIPISQKFTF